MTKTEKFYSLLYLPLEFREETMPVVSGECQTVELFVSLFFLFFAFASSFVRVRSKLNIFILF